MAKKTILNFNARAYMELAIAEMNKSKNEPRPDGKVPPKVGAVIVFSDGRVVQAHRGELRDGDHAEFTLIERKLVNEKLDDCVLFTTLEPCVERNHPKVPCCKRTTNARIKKVYVGIIDKDPTVSGHGILHLENHHTEVKMFDRDLQKIIEKENQDFLKQALVRKQLAEKEKTDGMPFMEQVVPSTNFDEFSTEALQKFILLSNLNYKIEQPEFKKYLSDLGVLAIDKQSKQLKPTGIGILLFGINPRLVYKQASLKCTVDYGDNQIETKDFDQPLVLIPNLVEDWIKKVLPQIKDTSNFKRQENSVFPIDVLREAVINALVHRDYTIEGAKSYFQLNNDTIIVKSPGAPLPSISLKQLNSFKAPSISRNPIITYVFNLMKYVEETGFGMAALKSLNQKYNLPLPEYHYENPFLSLIFPRTLDAVKKSFPNENFEELTNEELLGYEWIRTNEEISTKEYAKHFGYTQRTASRHLNKMINLKLIDTNGENQKSPKLKYKIKT